MSKTFDALKKLQQEGLFAANAAKPPEPRRATRAEPKAETRDAPQTPDTPSASDSTNDPSSVSNGASDDGSVPHQAQPDDGPADAAEHANLEEPQDSAVESPVDLSVEELDAPPSGPDDESGSHLSQAASEALAGLNHEPPPAADECPPSAEWPDEATDARRPSNDESMTMILERDLLPTDVRQDDPTFEPAGDVESSGFDLLINDSPVMTPELAEQLAELAALADMPPPSRDDRGPFDRSVDTNHTRPSAPHYDPSVHELVPDEAWQELEALAAAKSLEAEFQAHGQAVSSGTGSERQLPPIDETCDMTLLLEDGALPSDALREISPVAPLTAVNHYDPVIPSVDDMVGDLADDELATLPFSHELLRDSALQPLEEKAEPFIAPSAAPPREAVAESTQQVTPSQTTDDGGPELPQAEEETTVDWEPASAPSDDGSPPADAPSFTDATLVLDENGILPAAPPSVVPPDLLSNQDGAAPTAPPDAPSAATAAGPEPAANESPASDARLLSDATLVLDENGMFPAAPPSVVSPGPVSNQDDAEPSDPHDAASAATAAGPDPAANNSDSQPTSLARSATVATAAPSTGETMQNSALRQRISQLLLLPGGSSDAVRQCVQRIEERFDQRQPHVLLMTSAIETARTADVLFLLAHELRDSGRKVLLIDANLSQQQMTRALEAVGRPGLCDVLAGCREASDVAQPTGVEDIAFVPCGDDIIGVSRDVDLVPESAWVHAIHRWGSDFGYLLIDGGSTESTLLPTLARNSHVAVLLVPYAANDAAQLRSTARNLNSLAPVTVGCVLTDFPPTPA